MNIRIFFEIPLFHNNVFVCKSLALGYSFYKRGEAMRLSTILFTIFSSLSALSQVSILEENFDAQSLPAGWTIIDNDGNTPAESVSEYTEAWIYKEDPIVAGNGTFSSTSYFDPIDRADRWLITPAITLGSSGNFISWQSLSGDASFPDSYKVLISITDNVIASFTDTLALVTNSLPEWSEYQENLDDYAGQTIHIAFINNTFDGFKLYLDSIYVREQDPLAVSNEEMETVHLYPIPARQQLTVSASSPIAGVSINSSLGKTVLELKAQNGVELKMNVSSLPAGVYFVRIQLHSGQVISRRISVH
jgi:hypothetical protein